MAWEAFTSMTAPGPSCRRSSGRASSLVGKYSTDPPLRATPSAIFPARSPLPMANTRSIPSMEARAPML